MTVTLYRRIALALSFPLAGCAGISGSAAAPPSAPQIAPPRMVSRTLIEYSRPVEGRATIEVLINADGTPDLSTLRLTGILGELNRPDIERWLRSATFYPAQQAGQPVAGIFKWSMVINTQGTRLLGPRRP